PFRTHLRPCDIPNIPSVRTAVPSARTFVPATSPASLPHAPPSLLHAPWSCYTHPRLHGAPRLDAAQQRDAQRRHPRQGTGTVDEVVEARGQLRGFRARLDREASEEGLKKRAKYSSPDVWGQGPERETARAQGAQGFGIFVLSLASLAPLRFPISGHGPA